MQTDQILDGDADPYCNGAPAFPNFGEDTFALGEGKGPLRCRYA